MSQSHASTPSLPIDPRRNPSYPVRIHVKERADWQAKLAACEQTIETVRASLANSKVRQVLGLPNTASSQSNDSERLWYSSRFTFCHMKIRFSETDVVSETDHDH